jgi:hypothetical protein
MYISVIYVFVKFREKSIYYVVCVKKENLYCEKAFVNRILSFLQTLYDKSIFHETILWTRSM